MISKLRTQLTRPSASGWYYHGVPGGSETLIHCVTLLVPNEGLEGKALGSRGILADEPFFLTYDSIVTKAPTSTILYIILHILYILNMF